jgi:hypothetical protein
VEVDPMATTTTRFLAVIFAVVVAAAAWADEPKKTADNKLVGTWKRVSARFNGQDAQLPEGYTQLKHVTPTSFMWAVYDSEGKVISALGGSYTLKGQNYVETPEYGIGEGLDPLKGKPQEFTWKIEGNKWHHNGKLSSGLTIEEVWERVEKK